MNSWVKPEKQAIFIAKSKKKQFLLTSSGVITSTLGVSGIELHSSSTKLVNFFGCISRLGGHSSRLGGTSSNLGGNGPGMPPSWRRAWKHVLQSPVAGNNKIKNLKSKGNSFNLVKTLWNPWSNQIILYTSFVTAKRVMCWRGPTPCHCARAKKLLWKKCLGGGKPLATLCSIRAVRDSNFRPPAPETNTLPLDSKFNYESYRDTEKLNKTIERWNANMQESLNFMNVKYEELYFIHQIALARRERRDYLVFKSSCHLLTCLLQMVEASCCPFICWTSSRKAVNTNFFSLWFGTAENQTRVYRFCRELYHLATDRFKDWRLSKNKPCWYHGWFFDEM